jgi:hypothetical protein
MCASETYSKFRAGKDLPHTYPIQYGLKRGDAFQVSCNIAIRGVQENLVRLKSIDTHQLRVYADIVSLLGGNTDINKRSHKLCLTLVRRLV